MASPRAIPTRVSGSTCSRPRTSESGTPGGFLLSVHRDAHLARGHQGLWRLCHLRHRPDGDRLGDARLGRRHDPLQPAPGVDPYTGTAPWVGYSQTGAAIPSNGAPCHHAAGHERLHPGPDRAAELPYGLPDDPLAELGAGGQHVLRPHRRRELAGAVLGGRQRCDSPSSPIRARAGASSRTSSPRP
jgi:hypothetical protein